MGVSVSFVLEKYNSLDWLADNVYSESTPVGLQYEKFIIPDAVRILDAIVETLTY